MKPFLGLTKLFLNFGAFIILMIMMLLTYSQFSLSNEQPGLEQSDIPFNPHLIVDVPSPANRISEDQIKVYEDRVVLEINGVQWASFTDTNSMDPVIDTGANALQLVPKSPQDIILGDIISYQTDKGVIIHRVVEIGQDNQGWYAITQGDNIAQKDPQKVRFGQVKRVLIGIIY